jgi:hypothetical protein
MDISHIGAGSVWEIERLRLRQLCQICVFVIEKGHSSDSGKKLSGLLQMDTCPEIFSYDSNGNFAHPREFNDLVNARLAATGR